MTSSNNGLFDILIFLVPPELVKGVTFSMVNVSIPFGATLPLETPENITTIIGQNVMIPETYNLYIKCMVYRANPKASISWFHDNEPIRGQQYTVQDDGNLVIEDLTRGRDDGMYTCVAYTPNIGRDESSSTVIVTGKMKVILKFTFSIHHACMQCLLKLTLPS